MNSHSSHQPDHLHPKPENPTQLPPIIAEVRGAVTQPPKPSGLSALVAVPGAIFEQAVKTTTQQVESLFTVRPPKIEPPQAPPVIRTTAGPGKAGRLVSCNDMPLTAAQLSILDQQFSAPIADGAYWYDHHWGVWGKQGEGRSARLPAGLNLGGALASAASNGATGVFINGRQLGHWELLRLPGIPFLPRRRYWVDGQENYGVEGQPMLGNLKVMAERAKALGQAAVAAQVAASFSGSPSGGQRQSALSSWDRTGVAVFPGE